MLQAELSQGPQSERRPKLSDAVSQRTGSSFSTFTALPSNIEAVEAVMRFSDATHPFVLVTGPSGWGKSHLLNATVDQINRRKPGSAVLTSALQLIHSTRRQDPSECLVVDDVQDVLLHPRARHAFKQRLDLRVRTGRRTLLSWSFNDNGLRNRLELPLSRNWVVAAITEPTPSERELVSLQIASRYGLRLSRSLAKVLARHVHGNGRSIAGAMQRLRLTKSDWSLPEDVIPACGVLSPYLLGAEGWDPRDQIHDAVGAVVTSSPCSLTSNDFSCYLMLEEMGLSENEVATFLKVPQARAYNHARKVKSLLEEPEVADLILACRNAVLYGFEEE